jgi:hypothetical protein
MKLYKYRDLSKPSSALPRIQQVLQSRAFWCARPDTLNDPEEFAWTCDYTPSLHTARLLTELLVQLKGRTVGDAHNKVVRAINAGRLRELAEPTVRSIIHQCRNEIGLACFGSSPDNDILWDRYGGAGLGVCIEVEVPDRLIGTQLHAVQYWGEKIIHIDTLLRARLDWDSAAHVYVLSLLSKPSFWAPEAEIRFISKRQQVSVVIEGSVLTGVVLGNRATPELCELVRRMAPATPMRLVVLG